MSVQQAGFTKSREDCHTRRSNVIVGTGCFFPQFVRLRSFSSVIIHLYLRTIEIHRYLPGILVVNVFILVLLSIENYNHFLLLLNINSM